MIYTLKEAIQFKQNTRYSNANHRHQIDCRLGLWGVSAPTEAQAIKEAFHYYRQYAADGEYDEKPDKTKNEHTKNQPGR